MASVAAIAIKRETSLKRLNESMSDIAERLGLEVPAVPASGRDKDFLQAQQLEALAGFFEQVAAKLYIDATPLEPPIGGDREALIKRIDDEFTVAQLKEVIFDQGNEHELPSGNLRKAELIEFLIDRGFRGWADGSEPPVKTENEESPDDDSNG